MSPHLHHHRLLRYPTGHLLGCLGCLLLVSVPFWQTSHADANTFLRFRLYAAYKYLFGWCADQPDHLESGGLYYPKALKTIFVSLYLEEVCLAGLLFLSTDQNGKRAKSGLAGGVIMVRRGLDHVPFLGADCTRNLQIVMIIVTAAAQMWMQHTFSIERIVYSNSSLGVAGASDQSKLTLQPTQDDEAGEQYGNTTGLHEHAFDHPATWKDQPIVWLNDDTLGIGKAEVERLNAASVAASCEYATMDAEGKVHVDRTAPDEAWYGGVAN